MLHTLIQAYFGKLAFFVGWDRERHYELPETITLLGRLGTSAGLVGLVAVSVAILTPANGDSSASAVATANLLTHFISPLSLAIVAMCLVGGVCGAVLGVEMRRRYGPPDFDESRGPVE